MPMMLNKQKNNKKSFGTRIPLQTTRNISLYVLDQAQISQASSLWKRLESRTKNVGLTATWTWVESWLEIYGSFVDYWFFVAVQKNEPVGITLVTKETHRPLPLPVKAFHLGTYGEPIKDSMQMTNSRFLIMPQSKNVFYKALLEAIMAHFRCEEVVFDELAAAESDVLATVLKKNGYKFVVDTHPMLYLNFDKLREAGQSVSDGFSSSMRYAIRRTMKTLNDLEVEPAQTVEQAKDIFSELVSMYNNNVKKLGRDGKFASASYLQFQQRIIEKLFDKGLVLLFRVKSKQYGTLGCFYFLVDNGIAYFTQIGLRDFDDMELGETSKNKLKIGYLIHGLFMEECFKRNLRGYSFSTGIYPYKTQLTNDQELVTTISIRKSLKPIVRESVMKLYGKLDSNREASPFLRMLRTVINSITVGLFPKASH